MAAYDFDPKETISQDFWLVDQFVPLGQLIPVIAMAGVGKCLIYDTPVIMFDGTVKPVQDIKTGEHLMGPDSKPRTVRGTTNGSGEMYKIIPVKGDSFTVNAEHILSLKVTGKRGQSYNAHCSIRGGLKPGQVKDANGHCVKVPMQNPGSHGGLVGGEIVNISVKDYLTNSERHKKNTKLYRVEVEFPEKPVRLDPYFLGLWLGNGTSARPEITNVDNEAANWIRQFATSVGLPVHETQKSGCVEMLINNLGESYDKNIIVEALRFYSIFGNGLKRIPAAYLTNSRSIRLQVLAGLIDTDGSLIHGCYEIVSAYPNLAKDILFLTRSLGLAATVCNKLVHGKCYYRIVITGDISVIHCLTASKQASLPVQIKDALVTGFKIEPVGIHDYYGFDVGTDGLFLLGDFTVTHNSFFAESIAVCVAHGKPFLGAEVIDGDVVIIDQDTPDKTLKRRLAAMSKAMGCEKKHEIHIHSMDGLSLKDTLLTVIKQHPAAVLILIDSLNSVSVGLDSNSTNDMSRLSTLKKECLRPNRTIMITHHISQHADITLEDLMTGDPAGLAMGSSVLIQQADSYYIIGSPGNKNGKMSTLCVRPVAKRQPIGYGPVILDFHDDEETGMWFDYRGEYVVTENECQEDILLLFSHDGKDRTVREIYNDMREKWGMIKVRDELRELAHQNKLSERKEKTNAFVYRLPEKTTVKNFMHHLGSDKKEKEEDRKERASAAEDAGSATEK